MKRLETKCCFKNVTIYNVSAILCRLNEQQNRGRGMDRMVPCFNCPPTAQPHAALAIVAEG